MQSSSTLNETVRMSIEGTINTDRVIFATGGYDHSVKIWQAHTGICQRTCQHNDSQVNALDITPDRNFLAAAGYQNIRMYDIASNNLNPLMIYEGVAKNVTGLGFQEDGKWMYSGGDDCFARIWDLRSKTCQCQRLFQVPAAINCIALYPNQAEIIIGDQTGNIHLWDLRSDYNEILVTPEPEASVQYIAIDSEGKMMAAVNNKGNCFLWDLSGGVADERINVTLRQKFAAHERYALKCKFSPDASLLVTTSADQTAKVWKTSDLSLVQVLQHEAKRWVWDAAFSADSQHIFTASSDGVARLWNISTGTIERKYESHQKAITALAFRDAN